MSHSRWEHWIDSRTDEPESASDEGYMYPQPDGSTLEKGRMVNPDTGLDSAYEEVWDDEEPLPARCVVLRHEEGGARGLVVRLGRYSQGFLRIGSEVSLERWERRDGRAVRMVRMGRDEVPCQLSLMDDDGACRPGKQITSGGRIWTVVEGAA